MTVVYNMRGTEWARRNTVVLVLLVAELLGGLWMIRYRGYTEID